MAAVPDDVPSLPLAHPGVDVLHAWELMAYDELGHFNQALQRALQIRKVYRYGI